LHHLGGMSTTEDPGTAPDCTPPPDAAGASPALPHCCEHADVVLVGTAPRVGPLPELRTYRCRRCGHVETVEIG
jgi:hypothetical protein